jgi:hypothetical protein
MGDLEIWFADLLVPEREDVHVDHARPPSEVAGFPTEVPLDLFTEL